MGLPGCEILWPLKHEVIINKNNMICLGKKYEVLWDTCLFIIYSKLKKLALSRFSAIPVIFKFRVEKIISLEIKRCKVLGITMKYLLLKRNNHIKCK